METPDTAGAAPEAGEDTSPDYGPVVDRVGQLVDEKLSAFGQDFASRYPAPEPEAEPEQEDPWAALLNGDSEPEPEPDPQIDPAAYQRAVQAELEQRLGPIYDQLSRLGTSHDLGMLYEQYPDLKDPEVKQATGAEVAKLADAYEQRYGPEVGQLLRNDPEFVALVHRARVGQQNAAAEVAATGDTAQLEGGGGAAPGPSEQPNIVQQVMQSRRGLPKGFR